MTMSEERLAEIDAQAAFQRISAGAAEQAMQECVAEIRWLRAELEGLPQRIATAIDRGCAEPSRAAAIARSWSTGRWGQ